MRVILFSLLFFFLPSEIFSTWKAAATKSKLHGKWELVKITFSGKQVKDFKSLWNPQTDYYGIEITEDNKFKSYQFRTFGEIKWEARDAGKLSVKDNSLFFKEFFEYEHKRNGRVESANSHCGSGEFYCHPSFIEPWEHQPYKFKVKKNTLTLSHTFGETHITWHLKRVGKLTHSYSL